MNWRRLLGGIQFRTRTMLQEVASDLSLLADTSQLNRRTRRAWRHGRNTRACYLLVDHQRRRITRRREIRRLIET